MQVDQACRQNQELSFSDSSCEVSVIQSNEDMDWVVRCQSLLGERGQGEKYKLGIAYIWTIFNSMSLYRITMALNSESTEGLRLSPGTLQH
jgi:hypothetical protein